MKQMMVMVNSDWVFRHAGNCVIEFPPLELPGPPPGYRMHASVATLWRDPASPTGWTALPWAAADRGWELPRHLAIGDVIEFGLAALNPTDGRPLAGWDLRWRCWLRYCNDLALVVDGPYPTAPAASAAASETLAELRLKQLTGPAVDSIWQAEQAGCGIETEP